MLRRVLGSRVEYQVLTETITIWTAIGPEADPNPVAATLICLLSGAVRPVTGIAVCTGAWDRNHLQGLDTTAELDLRRWLDVIADHPETLQIADQATQIMQVWTPEDRRHCTSEPPVSTFPSETPPHQSPASR